MKKQMFKMNHILFIALKEKSTYLFKCAHITAVISSLCHHLFIGCT